MTLIDALLHILADGKRRSGVTLGRELGVTRAAVSKVVSEFRGQIPIEVSRSGYRLPDEYRPLDSFLIQQVLAQYDSGVDRLIILDEVDSTNRYLLAVEEGGVIACLAESQKAGRGRQGRSWVATPYANILLSISVELRLAPKFLGLLSLAVGVAVRTAMSELGVPEVQLKWPNDVLLAGRKLAGILIDMRGEAGALRAVVGIGLNCFQAPQIAAEIDQPFVSLRDHVSVDRSVVAGVVIARVLEGVRLLEQGEHASLLAQWRAHHALNGAEVTVQSAHQPPWTGRIQDIEETGGLRIMTQLGEMRVVYSGDVRVRLQ